MSGETAERNIVIGVEQGQSSTDALDHAIIETERGDLECTLFPSDCTEEALPTHWLTASGNSFVALAAVR